MEKPTNGAFPELACISLHFHSDFFTHFQNHFHNFGPFLQPPKNACLIPTTCAYPQEISPRKSPRAFTHPCVVHPPSPWGLRGPWGMLLGNSLPAKCQLTPFPLIQYGRGWGSWFPFQRETEVQGWRSPRGMAIQHW